MNRVISTLISALCLAAMPVALAQEEPENDTTVKKIGDYEVAPILADLQAWSLRQARKVVTDKTNSRMTEISLGVLKGEARAVRYSVGASNGLHSISGGLTYECTDTATDPDGFYKPLTKDELDKNCDWKLWQYSLEDSVSFLRDEVFAAMDWDAVAGFLEASGIEKDQPFPNDTVKWGEMINVYAKAEENAVILSEHTLKSCPSIDLVLRWFEGFKPTPVDIERYGDDVQFDQPKLSDKLYEAMIYSRVKGGFITVRYSGYSGEPQDIVEFMTAALSQCELEE